MHVIACDPPLPEAVFADAGVRSVTLDALLAGADAISLHCNLDAGNRGVLDAAAFARMERRPLLINVARGALVVEADLLRALDEGLVRGAALDVLVEDSPDLARHPLAGRADVLLTPHVAFLSDAALEELRRASAANLRHALAGEHAAVARYVVPPATD
jgi:D-3-phosphoglycerate dehydrogenase